MPDPETSRPAEAAAPPPLPALSRSDATATRAQNDWSGAKAALTPFPDLPPLRDATFKLLPEDISAGQAYLLGNPEGKGRSWVRLLLMTVGLVVLVLLLGRLLGGRLPFSAPPAAPTRPTSGGSSAFLSLVVPLVAPLAVILVFYFYLMSRARKDNAQALAQSEMHYVWLTSEYFGIRDALAETRYRWANVSAIEENPKYFFVRYRNNSLTPIPRRAFESEADARVFHEEMTRLCRAGGGGGKTA